MSALFTIDTDVSVEDDHSNHGLINSAIINNWQQSLDVGSVFIGSCILLLLLGLILYIKLVDKYQKYSSYFINQV